MNSVTVVFNVTFILYYNNSYFIITQASKRFFNNNNIKYLATKIAAFWTKERNEVSSVSTSLQRKHISCDKGRTQGTFTWGEGKKVWRRKTLQNRGFVVGGADLLEKPCYADFGLFQGFFFRECQCCIMQTFMLCWCDSVTVTRRQGATNFQLRRRY